MQNSFRQSTAPLCFFAILGVVSAFTSKADAPAHPEARTPLADWRLSPTPRLTIGRVAGDSDYLFADIADVLRRPNGTVVVGDNGGPSVRFYDEEGVFLRSVGGPGDGPGEFRHILAVEECQPGQIHVHDGFQNRITVLDATGHLSETFPVPLETSGFRPYRTYCNRNGPLVVTGQRGEVPRQVGPYRTELVVEVADLQGRTLDVLGRFVGDERFRSGRSDGPRALGRQTLLAVGSDRWFLGTGNEYRIRVFGFEGREISDVSVPDQSVPLTGQQIEHFIRRAVEPIDDPDQRDRQVRRWRDYDFPETLPPYDRLLVDGEGLLWVRDHRNRDVRSHRWRIFDPGSGTLEANLSVPAEFEIEQAGTDWVVGVWRGDLDVEQVRVYGLTRRRDGSSGR